MKTNFFTGDYLELRRVINKNFNGLDIRINKVGNLVVEGFNEKFTLRLYNNGEYLWSCYNYLNGYDYVLNMKGRKYYNNRLNVRDHDMNMYTFPTIDKAIDYIVKYFKQYRKCYGKNKKAILLFS